MTTTTLPTSALLAVLNAAPRGRRPILAPTVIRRGPDGWWLMSGRERGWERFGYRYNCLLALAAEWALEFTGLGRDRWGEYVEVKPWRGR